MMESFVAARDAAKKKVWVADHILTQTYPLVKDPKLLLAVLQNVYEAVDAGIESLLLYEHQVRRAPGVVGDFEARLNAFKQHVVPRYNVPREFLRFVSELRETIAEHRTSPVEFVRQGKLVICDDSYKVRTLTPEQLKRHVQRAKAFVTVVAEKVNRNDAVLARRD